MSIRKYHNKWRVAVRVSTHDKEIKFQKYVDTYKEALILEREQHAIAQSRRFPWAHYSKKQSRIRPDLPAGVNYSREVQIKHSYERLYIVLMVKKKRYRVSVSWGGKRSKYKNEQEALTAVIDKAYALWDELNAANAGYNIVENRE